MQPTLKSTDKDTSESLSLSSLAILETSMNGEDYKVEAFYQVLRQVMASPENTLCYQGASSFHRSATIISKSLLL